MLFRSFHSGGFHSVLGLAVQEVSHHASMVNVVGVFSDEVHIVILSQPVSFCKSVFIFFCIQIFQISTNVMSHLAIPLLRIYQLSMHILIDTMLLA